MRIAILAHVRQPIAEPFMGGMEAHSWHLAAELQARGHEVTLFASGDSDPRFTISPILKEHYERTFPWAEHKGTPALIAHVDQGFAAACKRLTRDDYDVVHNNSLHRFPLTHAMATRMPMVTSLHVPPFPALEFFVRASPAPWHHITVPSRRQLDIWFKEAPPLEAIVVHNGIDLERWAFAASGTRTAIWCGRIARNKGPHFAMEAAKIAGVPLALYGAIEERDYFDSELVPRLSNSIRYCGHLDGLQLSNAMKHAGVLLFTPCWDEPFGLVAVEAMACGVPIAAFDSGAAHEIIGDEAGRFAPPNDSAALSAALTEALNLDRQSVRHHAEQFYSANRMIQSYEYLYALAIDQAI